MGVGAGEVINTYFIDRERERERERECKLILSSLNLLTFIMI